MDKNYLELSLPFSFNEERNEIDVVFSAGSKFQQYGKLGTYYGPFYAFLEISKSAMNDERLKNNAPVLLDHNKSINSQIGVVTKAYVENGEARATIKFSSRPEFAPIITDIKNGIINNISAGVKLDKYVEEEQQDGIPVIRVTRWTAAELSFVAIPADFKTTTLSLDLDLKNKDERMTTEINLDVELKNEQQRVLDITKLCYKYGEESEIDNYISLNYSPEKVAALLLPKVAEKTNTNVQTTGNVTTTLDAKDKFAKGFELALLDKTGFNSKKDYTNEFRHYRLFDGVRKTLELNGLSQAGTETQLVSLAMNTSDFPIILGNVANKFLQKGFENAESTFDLWTNTVNLTDFKPTKFVSLSDFDDLEKVSENGEFKYGYLSEGSESVQLITWGKQSTLTRQAIINDDTSAFTRVMEGWAKVAKRTINSTVYARLVSSAAMSDSKELFHTDHANSGTGLITVANVDAGRVKMGLQKDISGSSPLGIRPEFLICPLALESTAKVISTSTYDPVSNKFQQPNPLAGTFQVVSDAELDSYSSAVWYLTTKQNDGIVVGYLNGDTAPVLDQSQVVGFDGIRYSIRMDWAVGVLDYRTLYKSTGV